MMENKQDIFFSKELEEMISDYLPRNRWFGDKGETISDVSVEDAIPVCGDGRSLIIAKVDYSAKPPARYLLALNHPDDSRTIVDLLGSDEKFGRSLLQIILRDEDIKGENGYLDTEIYAEIPAGEDIPEPSLTELEQSNSSLKFGDRYFMKIFRRLDKGPNPEIEIGAHFATRSPFPNATRITGSLKYRKGEDEYSLATIHEYIDADESAWDLFQKALSDTAGLIKKRGGDFEISYDLNSSFFAAPGREYLPSWYLEKIEPSSRLMELLGKRTGEMHKALADSKGDDNFKPEKITAKYQNGLFESINERASRVRKALHKHRNNPENRETISYILDNFGIIDSHPEVLKKKHFDGYLARIHGDYHFGQVLYDGRDFIILDFEGEPLRPVRERREKRLPLQDVAGMLRSIDYAVRFHLKTAAITGNFHEKLEPWFRYWRQQMCCSFMEGYLAATDKDLLPQDQGMIRLLTEILMLEKALYEVEYELSSRPDWVSIPLKGLEDLVPALMPLDNNNHE